MPSARQYQWSRKQNRQPQPVPVQVLLNSTAERDLLSHNISRQKQRAEVEPERQPQDVPKKRPRCHTDALRIGSRINLLNNKAVTTSTVVVFSPKPLTVQHEASELSFTAIQPEGQTPNRAPAHS